MKFQNWLGTRNWIHESEGSGGMWLLIDNEVCELSIFKCKKTNKIVGVFELPSDCGDMENILKLALEQADKDRLEKLAGILDIEKEVGLLTPEDCYEGCCEDCYCDKKDLN